MPQPEPAQRLVKGREPGDDTEAALELGLELGERDVGRRLDQPAQLGFTGFKERMAMAAVARRRRAAGRAHP